ncbi:MAG TPA: hypothetical protein VGE52_16110 [Pirellulales bacterium]
MGKFTAPKYPDALTAKSWSKEEGIIAKIVGKTDLGPVLAACEKAYKSVAWGKLDLEAGLRELAEPTAEDLQKLFAAGQSEVRGAIKALDLASRKVEDAAKEAETEFKKSGKIPKSSTAAAKKLYDAAKAFNYEICVGTMSGALQENFKAGEKYVEKAQADNKKAVAEMLSALLDAEAMISKVKSTEDARKFQTHHLSKIGANLQTALSVVPDLKDFHKGFLILRKEKINSMPDDNDDAERTKEYMAKVARIVGGMKKEVQSAKS